MRLGLTNYTYQWLFASPDGGEFVDRTSAEYDWRGLPLPYFAQTGTTVRPDSVEIWQIERAKSLDLPVVHCPIFNWEESNVQRIKALLTENDQELVPAVAANLVATGEILDREIAIAVDLIRRYGKIGGVTLSKFCVAPMVHNRFRSDPPLREQLDRITNAIPPLVAAATDAGIVLAFENHLDYRAKEVVEIIEAIDSPNLRFLFDTGNPFSVCEDPVDAAEVAAPYTVLVHVKDVRVVPWTPMSPGYFAAMYACPLGEGNVDLIRIINILAERAPNPITLPLAIEVTPIPPSADEDRWMEEGVYWMKDHLSAYISHSAGLRSPG
jgi:sugar phosphate isomerase/epimerase